MKQSNILFKLYLVIMKTRFSTQSVTVTPTTDP